MESTLDRGRIAYVRVNRLRAAGTFPRVLPARKQGKSDTALQRQTGAGTADDASAADKKYVHALFVTESPGISQGVARISAIHQRFCTSGRIFSS